MCQCASIRRIKQAGKLVIQAVSRNGLPTVKRGSAEPWQTTSPCLLLNFSGVPTIKQLTRRALISVFQVVRSSPLSSNMRNQCSGAD